MKSDLERAWEVLAKFYEDDDKFHIASIPRADRNGPTSTTTGLRAMLAFAKSECATRDAEIERLTGALLSVVDPLSALMSALRKAAEQSGRQLSGDAYRIANNLEYVKSIARAALSNKDAG